MTTQNLDVNGTYTIEHNYGEVQIQGLRNALNVFSVLWTHYHETSSLSDYREGRIRADLEKHGLHEDDCGYLSIHV